MATRRDGVPAARAMMIHGCVPMDRQDRRPQPTGATLEYRRIAATDGHQEKNDGGVARCDKCCAEAKLCLILWFRAITPLRAAIAYRPLSSGYTGEQAI